MKLNGLLLAITIITITLLVGCKSNSTQSTKPATSTSPTTSPTSSNQVNILGLAFSPQILTVAKGTTVTWTNNDSTTHTVTSDSGFGTAEI